MANLAFCFLHKPFFARKKVSCSDDSSSLSLSKSYVNGKSKLWKSGHRQPASTFQWTILFDKFLKKFSIILELPQSTVEACMDACLHNVSCLSFTFARNEQHCRLLSFDRSFNFTLPILETHIDYYELSCARDAILKSETSLSTSAPELSVPTETTILSTTSATPTTITATITEPLVELGE